MQQANIYDLLMCLFFVAVWIAALVKGGPFLMMPNWKKLAICAMVVIPMAVWIVIRAPG